MVSIFTLHMVLTAFIITTLQFLCVNSVAACAQSHTPSISILFENSTHSLSYPITSEVFYVPDEEHYSIKITCSYLKPVTWNFKLNTVSDQSSEDAFWIKNYRESDSLGQPKASCYFSDLKIPHTDNLLRVSYLTCYEVESLLPRSYRNLSAIVKVTLKGERNPLQSSQLKFHIWYESKRQGNISNPFDLLNSSSPEKEKPQIGTCDVEFWIKIMTIEKFQWKCAFSARLNNSSKFQSQQDSFCTTASHCSLYSQVKTFVNSCVKYFQPDDKCINCNTATGLSTLLLLCENEYIRASQVIVYSFEYDQVLPKLYVPGSDPLNATFLRRFAYLKEIPTDLVLGDEIALECHASEFMFATSPGFGLKYANSPDIESLKDLNSPQLVLTTNNSVYLTSVTEKLSWTTWYDFSTNSRVYRYSLRMTEKFWTHNGGLERVYCHLPVWNSDEWVSKFQDILKAPLNTVDKNKTEFILYESSTPKITISPEYPSASLSKPNFLLLDGNMTNSDKWTVTINCSFHEPIYWRILNPDWDRYLSVSLELRRKGVASNENLLPTEFTTSLRITGNTSVSSLTVVCSPLRNEILSSAVRYTNQNLSTESEASRMRQQTFTVVPFFRLMQYTDVATDMFFDAQRRQIKRPDEEKTKFDLDCPVILVIKIENASKGRFDWKFLDSQITSNVSSASTVLECDDFLSCKIKTSLSFGVSKEVGNCWKKLGPAETCTDCYQSTIDRRFSFMKIITWYNPQVGLIYQPVYKNGADPELYMSIPDSEKDIKLEGIPKIAYVGQRVSINCRASPFWYSRGLKLAFSTGSDYSKNVKLVSPSDWGFNNEAGNYIGLQINHTFTSDLTLCEIICFAPRCDSKEWANTSVKFKVLKSSFPQIWRGEEIQHATFSIGTKNESLECEANGIPKPTISWIYPVSNSDGYLFKNSLNVTMRGNVSVLHFKHTLQIHSGIYQCIAASVVGTSYKYYNVNIIDAPKAIPVEVPPYDLKLIVGLTVSGLGVIGIIVYLVWRIWFLEHSVKSLTELEIKEFRDGMPSRSISSVSADDATNSIIYCQPYNHTLEISRSNLKIQRDKILGDGNFGVVCLGYLLNNPSDPVALKLVKPFVALEIFKSFLSEIKVLSYVGDHLNIVKFYGACTSRIQQNDVILVLEFCKNGSLKEYISSHREEIERSISNEIGCPDDQKYENSFFGDYKNVHCNTRSNLYGIQRLLSWCYDIVNALEHLENKRIVHGDLAARNVLLSENFCAKISDFGLARILTEYSNYAKSPTNCPLPWKWLALESLTEKKFSCKSDVWAFGITMWEIFSIGEIPYPGVSWSLEFIDSIKSGVRPTKPIFSPEAIFELMTKCWAKQPGDRPLFTDLKNIFATILAETQQSRE